MGRHKKLLVALVVLLAFVAALWRHAPQDTKPESEHARTEKSDQPLELSAEQMQRAAIQVIPVPLRAAREMVEVGGVVKPDPSRVAKVSARYAGRVVRLTAKIGERLRAGD